MGQSTNAYLYYGFTIEEGFIENLMEEEGYEEPGDYDYWVALKTGGPKEPECEYEGNEKEHEKFWAARREHMKSLLVEISSHCSCDRPIHFVKIKSSFFQASRGYPEVLGKTLPLAEDWWDSEIKEFCEKTGIPYQIPRWELASMWC